MPDRHTAVLRACPDHGYFGGHGCPECGDEGRHVLDSDRREQLSKFVSGALRHFPGDPVITVDERGWTDYDDLVAAVERRYDWADRSHLDAVVATDPKGGFDRRGDRIRAAYGHSIDVALEPTDAAVPDRLYHGTAPRHVDAILDEGLRPMDRQQVHLSGSRADARTVGARHAPEPVVLVVDAAAMVADGLDVDRRGAETYTVDRVPPGYLARVDRADR